MLRFRSLGFILMVAFLIVLIPGCGQNSSSTNQGNTPEENISEETVFDFYNRVEIGQTKDQVDAELVVVPTESAMLENAYIYTDENTGYGVSVIYNENSQITSKTLFYPEIKDLAFLFSTEVTQEQADRITDGMTYDEVKSLLGEDGIEINATQIPFENNMLSFIRIWVNEDGSMIQVVFGTDGTVNNSMFFTA